METSSHDRPTSPRSDAPGTIALLLSGGLDSSILFFHLLRGGRTVQPLFVRSRLHWEDAERRAVDRIVAFGAAEFGADRVRPLHEFENPLQDVYGAHWSTTGASIPDAATPDEAVYLPGRNPLLLIKASVWCQLHGIDELALAPLGSNPFPDATPEFFTSFERMINTAVDGRLQIVRPFSDMHKDEVMKLASGAPLELTFSCIDPQGDLHCGACNKCAERQAAFRSADMLDPTRYAPRNH